LYSARLQAGILPAPKCPSEGGRYMIVVILTLGFSYTNFWVLEVFARSQRVGGKWKSSPPAAKAELTVPTLCHG
jgi:hypothetical protein